jgi:hypothetical protein
MMVIVNKSTNERISWVFFSLEAFKDFIEDDFDIKSFSANILQTKLVADYLQHLNELIRTLDAEIKQQVKNLV